MGLNLIQTAEHAYAAAAKDLVATGKFLREHVLPILKAAEADEPTIERITGLIDPHAEHVERAAFALLGVIIPLIEKAGEATTAGPLNLQIDAELLADLKPVIDAVKRKTLIGGQK